MPELPEVETMRRGIAAIEGRRIRDVRGARCRLRPIKITPRLRDLRRRAMGKRIVAVARAGKRVVVELESGDRIVFEPRMTGRLLLAEPPDPEHLRLVFELSGRPPRRLLFWSLRGLATVELMSPRRFAEKLGPRRLGPDALQISSEELRDRLQAGRRAIKVALMDQRALAGIGNLYASEILHRARLHPQLRCDQIRPAGWRRLHASMRKVLEEAIALQGSTLSDGTYRNPQNEAGRYRDRHRVYQRAGQECPQCRTGQVVRLIQAGRATFFCPSCQPGRCRG